MYVNIKYPIFQLFSNVYNIHYIIRICTSKAFSDFEMIYVQSFIFFNIRLFVWFLFLFTLFNTYVSFAIKHDFSNILMDDLDDMIICGPFLYSINSVHIGYVEFYKTLNGYPVPVFCWLIAFVPLKLAYVHYQTSLNLSPLLEFSCILGNFKFWKHSRILPGTHHPLFYKT